MSDLIDRQQAINALMRCGYWYTATGNEDAKRGVSECISTIYELQSVQPTQTNTYPTQINALDCISRQQAIDALGKVDIYSNVYGVGRYDKWQEDLNAIIELPSVQPKRYWIDSFTRKISVLPSTNNTGKWLGKYCPYTCDQCGKTSDSRTPFCRYCGADMREEK